MSINIKSIIYKVLTNTLGSLLVFFQPKRARKLTESGMTLSMSRNLSFTENLMRNAILKKVEKKEDYNTLEQFHNNYWKNQGDDFFSATDDSFEKDFLPNCAFIFDLLQEQLTNESDTFNTLVEIGTGNGKVLNYLSSKFPSIQRFVGIDLSLVQIQLNTENFKSNEKLEFVAIDGFDWVKEYGHGNIIFVTSRGVLEYFTEHRLTEFLNKLNGLGKTIFVAIEPNGIKHDFKTNPNSELYGYERSFSHNYAKLFKDAGFDLWHVSQKPCVPDSYNQSFIGAKN
ncbi:class I SAM-dependent methyltransferase [uncultured Winogradskyella sp.]|uniref:class I SAM-dependent methyltransferase n=1 Tax=uncultured Winogradskyella sp. TaxID=395353 RepID=UPI002631BA42|nr:class I SAM-dependent methyltransferase [uncultured Winogradskyella sp.]